MRPAPAVRRKGAVVSGAPEGSSWPTGGATARASGSMRKPGSDACGGTSIEAPVSPADQPMRRRGLGRFERVPADPTVAANVFIGALLVEVARSESG
jgi:hypothetical protein